MTFALTYLHNRKQCHPTRINARVRLSICIMTETSQSVDRTQEFKNADSEKSVEGVGGSFVASTTPMCICVFTGGRVCIHACLCVQLVFMSRFVVLIHIL